MFGPEIIEVATFRGHHEGHTTDRVTSQRGQNGMLLRDNIFGSIEEDAQRRDFTINSLYYSVADFTVRDYVGGMKGSAGRRDPSDRQPGNPLSRGSSAHAARGALCRQAQYDHQPGNG